MDHDTFIGQVQARARLDSRGAAEAATRATLETLAERIPTALAAQLPREVGEHLRRVATAPDQPETGLRMDHHVFLDRVATRAGAHTARAAHEARSVVEVVGEATEGGVLDRIRQALDDALAQLLFAGSTGSVT
ncbi:DUF2267 domain-containing protein [Streptomyces sp. GESEQ-4]|uniref:DUF2267 domain-containing protein n=1 Tax=Streptomyces sp. GESEQ-4 TaxID=2812655 RepID=UPI001B33EB75|nr:DUF2267 domain-containing protein [Streptomyces sp. GESEQ-4]